MIALVLTGDCRRALQKYGPFDLLIADPPYGETSLEWDRKVAGWLEVAHGMLKPSGCLWVFGSMRSFIGIGPEIARTGFRIAQDIVWEKHNGSTFLKDRFRRVHENALQLYRRDAAWSEVYNDPQKTLDATKRVVRRKHRPPHMNHVGDEGAAYFSVDGGPRLMRSVIRMRSAHGRAIHRTEKPVDLLEILIRTSCPPGGVVGDMFAGSGAAGEAAVNCGRNYIGTEIDGAMAKKARARISRGCG